MAVGGACESSVCYQVGGKMHFLACVVFQRVNPLGWDLCDVTISVGTWQC